MTELKSTTNLLRQIREGDVQARNEIIERYLPLLHRWARGRLPASARDLSETDDLVQITFLRALNRLEDFESERPGAFLAYLRAICLSALRDEIRRRRRAPQHLPIEDNLLAGDSSILEEMVGGEILTKYELGLGKMDETKRMAVVMRVEFGMSYREIAAELQRPSVNATRMLIVRAIDELAELMPR
ncbi:MAG: sigma-70 family RNA polymerase sigma factor [Pseudomonadota bacterium]